MKLHLTSYPYFDNNATTPIDNQVLEVLKEYNQYFYANPSSISHPSGMICNALYKNHRQKIADIIGVKEDEVIFTSGATESINTVSKGIYFQYVSKKNHIISCKTEHAAVLHTLKYLEDFHGANITLLDVDENGNVDLNELEKSITDKTLMVCLMAANNETGVMHPIDEIYRIARKNKVLFFSDTTQLFGKSNPYQNIPADIFCGSAHKFYGPKGIGFIAIKNLGKQIFLHPLLHGGNQQSIRSGTLPLPLIAALSKALEIIASDVERSNKIQTIRDYFEKKNQRKLFGENSRRTRTTYCQYFQYTISRVLL
jgi:cysteine desulfurase